MQKVSDASAMQLKILYLNRKEKSVAHISIAWVNLKNGTKEIPQYEMNKTSLLLYHMKSYVVMWHINMIYKRRYWW